MASKKPLVIDGELRNVSSDAKTIADVGLPSDVQSVITHDGQIVPRSRFAQVPLPQGFDANLSQINKGAVA